MTLTAHERVRDHVESAEAYSRELERERLASTEDAVAADQGHALRMVLYHGFAAVVAAIQEHGERQRRGR